MTADARVCRRARSRTSAAFVCALSAALCVVLFGFATTIAAAPIILTDDLGREVALREPAKRIVTLAPFLTELAFSAGAGGRVVGVSAHSDWPAEAAARPQVANAAGVSIEQVAALRADLVLAWKDGLREQDIERLRRLGIAVFVAQARALDDPPRLLEAIGRLAGTQAGPAAARYRGAIERLRAAHAGARRLRAFVEIWHRPLTTIAGPHWINEALGLCGADNVFADLPGVAPLVPWEQVYLRDPEVVVGAGSAADAATFEAAWREHPALGAVKASRLVFAHADTIQRPTLRLAEGVARLCDALERARRR